MPSPNTLSDGGLQRGSYVLTIPDSTNANLNVNVLLKTFDFEQPVRSSYEYDENGLPKAASHVRDFKKLSITFMGYANTNAPAAMAKFGPTNVFDGVNTNYTLLGIKRQGGTEGLKSFSAEAVEVIN